jgi:hypothetical protein
MELEGMRRLLAEEDGPVLVVGRKIGVLVLDFLGEIL